MFSTLSTPIRSLYGVKKYTKRGNTPQKADFIETFYDTQPPDERFSNCSNFLSRPLLSELRNEWG